MPSSDELLGCYLDFLASTLVLVPSDNRNTELNKPELSHAFFLLLFAQEQLNLSKQILQTSAQLEQHPKTPTWEQNQCKSMEAPSSPIIAVYAPHTEPHTADRTAVPFSTLTSPSLSTLAADFL